MSIQAQALTSSRGAGWVQINGPTTKREFLGCTVTLPEVSYDLGATELIQVFNQFGTYSTIGTTKAAPGVSAVSLEVQLTRNPDLLEKLRKCRVSIWVLQSVCGNVGDENNFVRAIRLDGGSATTRTYTELLSRNEDNPSMMTVEFEFFPEENVFHEVLARRQTFTGLTSVNDVWFNTDVDNCNGDCGEIYSPGDHGVIVTDAGAGVPAEVFFTFNAGVTWTASAADPFGNDEGIQSVTAIYIGNNMIRTIVAIDASDVAAGQGMIAYADHAIGSAPTAWTTVNIGGATAGHGAAHSKCLFALDKNNTWLAASDGFIYFSSDRGVTWAAQESALIHSGSYNGINFVNDNYGVAVGDADIVAVTTNGGESWAAATAPGGGFSLHSCVQHNANKIVISGASGSMYFSTNGGTSWTQLTNFTNSGVGIIKSMHWLNEQTGFIVHDDGGPIGSVRLTIDGGYSFKDVGTDANSGLNSIWAVNNNLAGLVGNIDSATGFVGRVSFQF